jgi:N-acyl-D-amino-acid deacylase
VIDAADFQHSTEPAKGIEKVLVNGELVWDGPGPTGRRPGRVLTRDGASPGMRR